MRRRFAPETVVTAFVVGASAAFVLAQLDPSKLFLDTTPAGGDMGAHVWAPAFLRDNLLPNWRLTGWAPDWYAGFPALTFYFPLPSMAIVLLDVVLPYNVAFKLISVSGLVTLPVAAWAFGRLSGMRFPGPPLLALATVPFLFDRSWTILGGNVPSTLAGEFSFSIGLSLALVFLGLVARGLDDGRHRGWAAVLLAACALSHVLTTLFAIVGAGLLWLQRLDRERTRWIITTGAVAFALAAFWAVPVIVRLPYMNDMGWERTQQFLAKLLWPDGQWRIWPLAGVGAVLSVLWARRTGTVLTALAAVSALAFRFVPQGRLWNERFLPFWYLCLYLLAAVAISELAYWLTDRYRARQRAEAARQEALVGVGGVGEGESPFDWALGDEPVSVEPISMSDEPVSAEPDEPVSAEPVDEPVAEPVAEERSRDWSQWPWPSLAVPMVALLAILFAVGVPLRSFWFAEDVSDDRSFIPDWVAWNYSGYEEKAGFPEYDAVVDTMARVGEERGCGRAMWEYGLDRLNPYGTPMALMLLPYWTDGCIGSMEGLYFESAASVPYHFLAQSELSKAPSRAMRNLPYRELDLEAGVEHMKLLGVRYYMAFTPEILEQAKARTDLELVATSGPWTIFELKGAAVVEALPFEPVVIEDAPMGGDEWVDVSVAAYQDPGPVLLAADGPDEWERVEFGERPPTKGSDGRPIFGSGVVIDPPPRAPVRQVRVTNVETSDDTISFDVDQVGTPVLVKASYFPNWKASGAEGPWRVAPNFMVVVPTERHVELHYGFTPVDWLGWLMTLAGIVGVVLLARRPAVVYGKVAGDVDTAGEAGEEPEPDAGTEDVVVVRTPADIDPEPDPQPEPDPAPIR